VASWGWLQSLFFIVCINQSHFFLSLFSSTSMIFFNFYLHNIMGGEEEWGGQLGVASWGWLQTPFFIVCLNQGHFFSKSFFINLYGFFRIFFLSKYHRERSGGRVVQEHECPKESLKLSLPGSCQNLISIFKSNPADFGRSQVTQWSEVDVDSGKVAHWWCVPNFKSRIKKIKKFE
jgi:hypothetical protein